jgi:hypothetical protein
VGLCLPENMLKGNLWFSLQVFSICVGEIYESSAILGLEIIKGVLEIDHLKLCITTQNNKIE